MHSLFKGFQGLLGLTFLLAPLGASGRVIHYVSFSMPKALLHQHLLEAGRESDGQLLFRGLNPGPQSGKALLSFLREASQLRSVHPVAIRIDPKAFETDAIDLVPVVARNGVLHRQDARFQVREEDPRISWQKALKRISPPQFRSALIQGSPPQSPLPSMNARAFEPYHWTPRFQRQANGHEGHVQSIPTAGAILSPPLMHLASSLLLIDGREASQRERLLQYGATPHEGRSILIYGLSTEAMASLQNQWPSTDRLMQLPESWIEPLGLQGLPATINPQGDQLVISPWQPSKP